MHVIEVGGEGIPTVKAPGWEKIAELIRALDGKTRRMVVLKAPGGAHFGIMATATLLYNCTVFDDATGRGSVLVSPGYGAEIVSVYLNEVERRELVDLSVALMAARTYAERGEMEKSVIWEDM